MQKWEDKQGFLLWSFWLHVSNKLFYKNSVKQSTVILTEFMGQTAEFSEAEVAGIFRTE